MCLDCSCGKANDDHQDSRHIILDDLRAAAEASGVSTIEAARRIYEETKRAVEQRMLGSASETR